MATTKANNLYRVVGFVDKSCSYCRGMDPEWLPYNFEIYVESTTKERAIYIFLKHYPDFIFTDIVCYHIGICIVCKDVEYLSKSEVLSVVQPFINPSLF